MGVLSDRLFHTIVVLGAGPLFASAACAARPDTARPPPEPRLDPAAAGRDADAPQPPEPPSEPKADAADAGACECAGEGQTCEANGVLCCWATAACCEPCCPA